MSIIYPMGMDKSGYPFDRYKFSSLHDWKFIAGDSGMELFRKWNDPRWNSIGWL